MSDERRTAYLERREYLRNRPLALVDAQPVDLTKHPLLDTIEKRRAFLRAGTNLETAVGQIPRSASAHCSAIPAPKGR